MQSIRNNHNAENDDLIIKLRKYALVFFFLYALLCVASIVSFDLFNLWQDYALELSGQLFAIVLIVLAKPYWIRGGESSKRVWGSFFLGSLFFFLGDFAWFYLEYVEGISVTVPSICDFFYIISYVFLLLALFFYVRTHKTRSMRVVLFDIVISFLTLGLMVFKFGIVPDADGGDMSFEKIINLFYPLMDVFYLIGLLALVFLSSRSPQLLKEVGLITGAFVCFLFADQHYLISSLSEDLRTFAWDPVWSVGLLLLSLASLYATPKIQQENQKTEEILLQAASADGIFYHIQTASPYIFAMLLVIVVGWDYIFNESVIFLINLAMLLIISRQLHVLMEKRQLITELANIHREVAAHREKLAQQHHQLTELHEQKTIEASTDFLTELKNRRHINEVLDGMSHTSAAHVTLGLMLIDVDHFKPINDTWGHQVGDEVLRLVANAIASVARSSDIAGRFGGDEFVLVLPGADVPTLHKVAQRLLDAIAQAPLPHAGIKLGLSIGAAAWVSARADYDKEALLLKADKALYAVKEAGRNGYRVAED